MRIPAAATTSGVGINMTPMIDVVFQLIIFFLVSSHLVQQESQLELPLPLAATGEEDAPSELPRLTINVLVDGQIIHAGHSLSTADLEQKLRDEQHQYGQNVEVRIRCDRAVIYRHVTPVMLACTRAGLWNVSYAVVRRGEEQ